MERSDVRAGRAFLSASPAAASRAPVIIVFGLGMQSSEQTANYLCPAIGDVAVRWLSGSWARRVGGNDALPDRTRTFYKRMSGGRPRIVGLAVVIVPTQAPRAPASSITGHDRKGEHDEPDRGQDRITWYPAGKTRRS